MNKFITTILSLSIITFVISCTDLDEDLKGVITSDISVEGIATDDGASGGGDALGGAFPRVRRLSAGSARSAQKSLSALDEPRGWGDREISAHGPNPDGVRSSTGSFADQSIWSKPCLVQGQCSSHRTAGVSCRGSFRGKEGSFAHHPRLLTP